MKVSNLASKEGSYFLVVLFFFGFFPFACMDFPRSHFPFRQPTGRWKEDEEVGEMIDNFSFAHRSVFAIAGKERRGACKNMFLIPSTVPFPLQHACLFLRYTYVVQFSLAYFFLGLISPSGPLFSLRTLLGFLFFRCRCRLLPEVWQHSGPFLYTFWETLDGCRWN